MSRHVRVVFFVVPVRTLGAEFFVPVGANLLGRSSWKGRKRGKRESSDQKQLGPQRVKEAPGSKLFFFEGS